MSLIIEENELSKIRNLFNQLDASKGIGESLFLSISQLTPIVNVDLILRNSENNSILLTWRDDHYYGPGWHIPGGVLRYKERLVERVQKVAKNELNIDLNNFEFLGNHEMFNNTRNIRGHFVSFVYQKVINFNPPSHLKAGPEPKNGQWKWFVNCPKNFIFNQRALKRYFEC